MRLWEFPQVTAVSADIRSAIRRSAYAQVTAVSADIRSAIRWGYPPGYPPISARDPARPRIRRSDTLIRRYPLGRNRRISAKPSAGAPFKGPRADSRGMRWWTKTLRATLIAGAVRSRDGPGRRWLPLNQLTRQKEPNQ